MNFDDILGINSLFLHTKKEEMTIIADSGSTKTDWCLCEEGRVVATIQTQGINPFHQTEETIRRIIHDELCSPVFFNALIGKVK